MRASGTVATGRFTTRPSAPVASCRSMYTTVCAKRGSPRLCVATSSWPCVLLRGGDAGGSDGRVVGPTPADVARTISSATGVIHVTWLFLGSLPVLGVAREDGRAPRRLRRAVERIGGGAPLGVVRRCPMGL